jgi:hypothetical protein
LPCELTFDWRDAEVPASTSPYKDDLIAVEFRSPRHTTYLMRAFWDGAHNLRVRFSPTEAGTWTYHVTSSIKRYDDHETTFEVAESALPGFVAVANVRHWWTTNKQPHLWLAASAPFLQIDEAAWESWLDARKHDGFTHVRGTLLTSAATAKPLTNDGEPNFAYFATLDARTLAADSRGFTLDLILADASFLHSGALATWSQRDTLIRYLIARYGGLNVTWQGIEHFEDVTDSRALLKDFGSILQKYDSFQHPRSTDARVSSSPLTADGWMNYLVEASPRPDFGAVEHQFTAEPEIHVISATDPEPFRHELWTATTNGEYPSVSYEALRNEANRKAIRTWLSIISDTRHWEFEPYFDVDGARAVGLEEIGYIAYAERPGIVEINLEKHKYNPRWVNPSNGEETPLKDQRTAIYSRQTPDNSNDWILDCEREGHRENMLRSVRFESIDAPIQEIETDSAKVPFDLTGPPGDSINPAIPTPFAVKLTRTVRATRRMQYIWWGEIVGNSEGPRLLGLGSNGTFRLSDIFPPAASGELAIRIEAINANGKAYEVNRVYRLTP